MLVKEVLEKLSAGELEMNSVVGLSVESKVQIIIAPRGWVFVGYTSVVGEELVVDRANVIRIWGTKRGLGELMNGPLAETKLDPCGTTRIPLAAIIAKIDCEESKWLTKI